MKTTIKLYDSNEYRCRSVPESLPEMIQWLTGLLEEVPSEFHDHVEIGFDSEPDTCSVQCIVSYSREETEAERVARETKESDWKRRLDEKEREQFERLKAKFEP